MNHLLNWIEIPIRDFDRAKAFYEHVFEIELTPFSEGALTYAIFPTKNPYNTGALVKGEGYVPSTDGPLIYLNATNRLDTLLARALAAGGQLLTPSTLISPEAGQVAIFIDPEGNRIGLRSPVASEKRSAVDDATMQRLLAGNKPALAFLFHRGPTFDDPTTQPLQWEHARNMLRLLKEGKLIHVTALLDGTTVLGFGMLATENRDEALQLLSEDPAVRGGRLRAELLSGITFRADEVKF